MLIDPLIPDWLLQIIIASVGATISGFFLLIIHHSKVKEELEIHRKKEVFDRKQKMYRDFYNYFLERLNLESNAIHDRGNWRIGDYFYTELLLIGGENVIHAVNKHLNAKLAGNVNNTEESNNIKDILIEIRKDLYGENLDKSDINFIQSTQDTNDALEIIENNYDILKKYDFTTLQSITKMDVEQMVKTTQISEEKLNFLKNVALKEKKIYDEFRQFLDNASLNHDIKKS